MNDSPAFVQTISSQELRTAGITRIADILLLSDLWDIKTTDGINWTSVANGLGTLQQQHFHIFLDGQKLDAKLFDALNINLLGLTLEQIDSVHIGSTPSLINGEFTVGGYIHFFTSRNGDGWSFTGSSEFGNETGDPGPYLYTEQVTTNVDRVGPTSTVTISYNRPRQQNVASVIVQEHPFTDLAMFGRTSALAIEYPMGYSISPTFIISRKVLGGWQNIRASYSSSNKFYLPSQSVGFETPVHVKFADAGMDGQVRQSDKISWNYRWNYSSHNLAKLPNTLDFEYDWRQSHLSGNVEMVIGLAGTELKFGIGGDQYHLETDAILNGDQYTVLKTYGTATKQISHYLQMNLTALLNYYGGKTSGNIVTSGKWRLNKAQQLNFTYSLGHRLHAVENPQLIWLSRGYGLYEWSNSGDGITDKLFDPSRQQTVDINWHYNISSQVSTNVGISYRKVDGLTIEDRQIGYNSTNFHFPTINSLISDEAYNVIGVHASGSGQFSPRLKWHLSSRLWFIMDATTLAETEWEKLPARRIKGSMTWTPVSGFAIWLMATKVPSTYWVEYEEIDGTPYPWGIPQGKYLATVPPWTRIDLQIRKDMWHKRFALFLLLRNILDEEVRYHPVGATFHMTLHLKGQLSLDKP